MKRNILFLVLAVLWTFGITANAQGNSITYLVLAKGQSSLPQDLDAMVAERGGVIQSRIPQVGIAVVNSSNPDFMGAMAGVRSIKAVIPNFTIQMPDVAYEPLTGNPPDSGDDDFYFDLQWGHDAVNAPEAWDAGVRGAGVRVAVLDTGTDRTHPDIAPNFNGDLSTSFLQAPFGPLPENWHFHGTHTAGTIAAADNAFGTIGVAPDAEIFGVQVCGNGGCPAYALVAGIVYAADNGADLINMSLGGFDLLSNKGFMKFCTKELGLPAPVCATAQPSYIHNEILVMQRAFQYANQQGTTTVVSAGNSAADGDHDIVGGVHYPSLRFSFADYPGTIAVSATAPIGWCLDSSTDLNVLADYSNFGRSVIDFSAPGGNGWFFEGDDTICWPGVPAWVLDLVFSTTPGGWSWAGGTSMAAPHVTGIAALIISENGGPMKPSQVLSELRNRAEDLGAPGQDPEHGNGGVRSGY